MLVDNSSYPTSVLVTEVSAHQLSRVPNNRAFLKLTHFSYLTNLSISIFFISSILFISNFVNFVHYFNFLFITIVMYTRLLLRSTKPAKIFFLFTGKVHLERHGKRYHFSWLEVGEDRKFKWEEARNYCRRFCMDAISIESDNEWDTVVDTLKQHTLRYIWTGGRKCNFNGCDRPDLTPNIVNGWFWAARRNRIPAKGKCSYCDWSFTGG